MVVETLVDRTFAGAAPWLGAEGVGIAGGVSANEPATGNDASPRWGAWAPCAIASALALA